MAEKTVEQLIVDLNRCLTVLSGSMAGYVADADAYTTDADKDAIGAIREVAAADRSFSHEITAIIEDLEGIPQIGGFDHRLALMNYLSYPYILDLIADHIGEEISRYTELVETCPNYPDARSFLKRVLSTYESSHQKMKDIRAKRYKSAEPEPEPAAKAEGDAAEA